MDNLNITYSILQPVHAAAYRSLRLESLELFPGSFGSSYEDEKAKPVLAFERFIEQCTPGKFVAGAFGDETLIGICGFAGEETAKNNHRGAIIQMYVRRQFSGKGIGLQLLKTAIDAAFNLPGMEQLVLGVVTENKAAIRIYEKAGFTTLGVQRNYFKTRNGYLHQQFMVLYKTDYEILNPL